MSKPQKKADRKLKCVSKKDTTLIMAIYKKKPWKEIEKLIAKADSCDCEDQESGDTPLILASAFGMQVVVEALIAHGASPNKANKKGQTPLQRAAVYGRYETLIYLLQISKDSVSVPDTTGHTPLHYCAGKRRGDCLRALINARADPNVADMDGKTALHFAVTAGFPRGIKELAKAGADVDKPNNAKNCPIHMAVIASQKRCLEALIKAGAQLDQPNGSGKTAEALISLTLQYSQDAIHKEIAQLLENAEQQPKRSSSRIKGSSGHHHRKAGGPLPPLPPRDYDESEYASSSSTPSLPLRDRGDTTMAPHNLARSGGAIAPPPGLPPAAIGGGGVAPPPGLPSRTSGPPPGISAPPGMDGGGQLLPPPGLPPRKAVSAEAAPPPGLPPRGEGPPPGLPPRGAGPPPGLPPRAAASLPAPDTMNRDRPLLPPPVGAGAAPPQGLPPPGLPHREAQPPPPGLPPPVGAAAAPGPPPGLPPRGGPPPALPARGGQPPPPGLPPPQHARAPPPGLPPPIASRPPAPTFGVGGAPLPVPMDDEYTSTETSEDYTTTSSDDSDDGSELSFDGDEADYSALNF